MKSKFLILIIIVILTFFTGSSCTNNNNGKLNIREQPGIEYCSTWCSHMIELVPTDPNPEICEVYLEPIVLENDAGTLSCTQFCEYEMKNSIQLNPECMSKVSQCDQIECASLLESCEQIEERCK
ncbi:MAG TPA: hypothetical protein VMX17_04620 [Candidatus Glassbacteria bacterium]|nr:hypothetical protein [Candidatus Glassbacteria bacterium]